MLAGHLAPLFRFTDHTTAVARVTGRGVFAPAVRTPAAREEVDSLPHAAGNTQGPLTVSRS